MKPPWRYGAGDLGNRNWSNVTVTIQDDGMTRAVIVTPPTGIV